LALAIFTREVTSCSPALVAATRTVLDLDPENSATASDTESKRGEEKLCELFVVVFADFRFKSFFASSSSPPSPSPSFSSPNSSSVSELSRNRKSQKSEKFCAKALNVSFLAPRPPERLTRKCQSRMGIQSAECGKWEILT